MRIKRYRPATRRQMDIAMSRILQLVPDAEQVWQEEFFTEMLELFGTQSQSVVMALVGLKYIEFEKVRASGQSKLVVTRAGWVYFETRRRDRFDLLVRGLLLPLVVAIIGTLLTNLIWRTLQDPPVRNPTSSEAQVQTRKE